MPSKLKKALGAVKDHTSISLAKVGSNNPASNLEVAILKATSHDASPTDEACVTEILQLVASNKVYAATCAHVISKRVGKTKTWTVALKSLMLVFRVLQDGDSYFPQEVLHTMKNGGRILNLSTFRDRSKAKNPWDFTAYVRLFALYLEERLDCFLMGKLQRRVAFRKRNGGDFLNNMNNEPIISDMKPAMVLDRISYWQRLLDQTIATRPTGAAKMHSLVQITIYSIVQESFDLYRDISEGLTLLLDNFFHLPYQLCLSAFQTCVKASQQFEDLSGYYALCKSMGVGRTSEYPSVQKISDELIETLREFLKDQSSFPNDAGSLSPSMLPSSLQNSGDTREIQAGKFGPEHMERYSEKGSEFGPQSNSLDDPYSNRSTSSSSSSSPSISPSESPRGGISPSLDEQEKPGKDIAYKPSQAGHSSSLHQGTNPNKEFVSFEEWPMANSELIPGGVEHTSGPNDLFNNGQPLVAPPVNNPFLDDAMAALTIANPTSQESFSAAPTFHAVPVMPTFNALNPQDDQLATFQATSVSSAFDQQGFLVDQPPTFHGTPVSPTFNAQSSQEDQPPTFQATPIPPTFHAQSTEDDQPLSIQNDPFSSDTMATEQTSFNTITDEESLQMERQIWLQQQNKIISKHMGL